MHFINSVKFFRIASMRYLHETINIKAIWGIAYDEVVEGIRSHLPYKNGPLCCKSKQSLQALIMYQNITNLIKIQTS